MTFTRVSGTHYASALLSMASLTTLFLTGMENAAKAQSSSPDSVIPAQVDPSVIERLDDIEPGRIDQFDNPEIPPSQRPLPERQPTPTLPPPDELLRPPGEAPILPPAEEVPATIRVERFEVIGSTVFDDDDFAEITAPYEGQELSFAELLQVRSAITQLYVDAGYVTSGAFIPPQTLDSDNTIVTIQVLEGRVEEINVEVEGRLRPGYVRRRLALAASDPLNTNELLEGLQLLQLDPLIDTISAELAAGVRPGTSILDVQVVQADTFAVDLEVNNGRSPSVGSFRREIQISEGNLIGIGDGISVGYSNTDGSNTVDLSYVVPVNARNGTVAFSYGTTTSSVIEDEFEILDIASDSRFYELTYRQPLYQSPTREFALSLTASRRESESEFLEDLLGEAIPFPSLGADEEGRTRISVLRFAQEWTQQGGQQVIAGRSQFSIGLDTLDSTINENGPDSRFFSWRGQGQWVKLLAADTILLVRGDIQLADAPLVPLEQFGLGGQQTVRGYRQDELLTDNGILLSSEMRIPLVRARRIDGLLQIAPFVDIGHGWNLDATDPDPSLVASVGLGLLWRMGDRLSARLDYGLPLVDTDTEGGSLQEDGFYFSLRFTPF